MAQMEAAGLIKATRQALARGETVPQILAESWQAQALARAVGGRLASRGPRELRSHARELAATGGRRIPRQFAQYESGARAALLSGVDEPRMVLVDLGELLGECAAALVGIAARAEEAALYWQCVEAIDALDESGDRVAGMLRALEVPEEHGGLADHLP
ncbi:DUF6099 family protein [Streptomyces sp. NPDC005438]|uniref:DUF6099 family protein n=1 Tax=Streptomyces sp. NPDC005438 TaxID=3156880 RepID=UPI0033BB2C81